MIANLSIDSIISDHENAELDIEFSKMGQKAKKKSKFKKYEIDECGQQITKKQHLSHTERLLVLNGRTLLCIIYCALNICKSNIQLSDLIRFVREGHLSYFKCKNLLPEDHNEEEIPLSYQQHHSYHMINYESLRKHITNFTKLIPDLPTSIKLPDILKLCHRYMEEMSLPKDFHKQVERLIVLLPPVMLYQQKSTIIPNYEARAMAFIIFALKLLFGIDSYREEQMSNAARKINEALKNADIPGTQKKLFVYKDWMNFIEYRKVILEKYHYTMLFHPDYSYDKPYLALNSMLNSINPTTKNLESNHSSTSNTHRMRLKKNIEQYLVKQSKEYPDTSVMGSVSFQSSFLPFKENFQRILRCDASLNIFEDFTEQVCEPYLRPKVFVESCKNFQVELLTKPSTFPKSFLFVKPEVANTKNYHKENYKLTLHAMTEKEWREDLKKRKEFEKEFYEKEGKKFHKRWLKKTLEKRQMWRTLIRKKNEKRSRKSVVQDVEDQPRNIREKNILSDDSDSDISDTEDIILDSSIDRELQQIFERHEEEHGALTLITPDYNVWQHAFQIFEDHPNTIHKRMEKLPQNFRWLLNLGASILHQDPKTLYYQVLCVEHQFMNVYQPVELMDNVMIKQNAKKEIFHQFLYKIERDW